MGHMSQSDRKRGYEIGETYGYLESKTLLQLLTAFSMPGSIPRTTPFILANPHSVSTYRVRGGEVKIPARGCAVEEPRFRLAACLSLCA